MARFQKKTNKGFTLIETAVVMAVISIAAGVSFPTYRNLQTRAIKESAQKAFLSMKSQCETSYTLGFVEEVPKANIRNYRIQSTSNTCEQIQAIPNDPERWPTYSYDMHAGTLTCDFAGAETSPFPECKKINSKESNKQEAEKESRRLAQERAALVAQIQAEEEALAKKEAEELALAKAKAKEEESLVKAKEEDVDNNLEIIQGNPCKGRDRGKMQRWLTAYNPYTHSFGRKRMNDLMWMCKKYEAALIRASLRDTRLTIPFSGESKLSYTFYEYRRSQNWETNEERKATRKAVSERQYQSDLMGRFAGDSVAQSKAYAKEAAVARSGRGNPCGWGNSLRSSENKNVWLSKQNSRWDRWTTNKLNSRCRDYYEVLRKGYGITINGAVIKNPSFEEYRNYKNF